MALSRFEIYIQFIRFLSLVNNIHIIQQTENKKTGQIKTFTLEHLGRQTQKTILENNVRKKINTRNQRMRIQLPFSLSSSPCFPKFKKTTASGKDQLQKNKKERKQLKKKRESNTQALKKIRFLYRGQYVKGLKRFIVMISGACVATL